MSNSIDELTDHWTRLREMCAMLRDELNVPATVDLIPREMCRHFIEASRRYRSSLPRNRWDRPPGVPWQLRRPLKKGAIQVRLAAETDVLYSYLQLHLKAEFPTFDVELFDFKGDAGELTGLCLDQARRIVRSCSRQTGLKYVGGGVIPGLFETAPAYVCRRMLGSGQTTISWSVIPFDAGVWQLVPRDRPACSMAAGSWESLNLCAQQLNTLITAEIENPAWRDIAARREHLSIRGTSLQAFLESTIKRGTFQGQCPVC